MKCSTCRPRAAVAVALAMLASAAGIHPAFADEYGYNTASGDWTVAANWAHESGGTGTVPGAADDAYIGSTTTPGSALIAAVDLNSAATVGKLRLSSGGGSGTLNLNAGGALTVSNLFVGDTSQPGVINRLGGTLNLLTVAVAAGSTLDVIPADTVNLNSHFTVSGGATLNYDNSSTGPLSVTNVTNGGTLDLQGGTLRSSNLRVGDLSTNGGPGHVLRTGGLLDVQTVNVDRGSTLNIISGDTIGPGGVIVSRTLGSTILYDNSSPNLAYAEAGNHGTLDLRGGTLHTDTLAVGIGARPGGAGTLLRNGGLLDARVIYVTTASTLDIINGDTIATGGTIDVGGTLNFNASIANNLAKLGVGVGGTVNLNGGTMRFAATGAAIQGSGFGGPITVNFNGTTLTAAAPSTTWITGLSSAKVQTGGAKFDTNGFNITVPQTFSHDPALGATPDGGLTKTGPGTLTLTSANNAYTGGTTVNAGTLEVKRMHQNNGVTVNAGTLRVLESAPGLATGHPAGNNAFVSRPSSLSVSAGATLDLTNNDLILDYTGPSPIADYEALVASGYNGIDDWAGTGITSSVTALDGNYVLAVADNVALAAPFGSAQGGPLFAGQDVDLTTILVKFTHRADINLDGLVTPDDSAVFGGNYDENQPAVWATGDMNYDGIFTPDDAAIFGGAYDESLNSLPEPANLCVLGVLSLAVARRRVRAPRG